MNIFGRGMAYAVNNYLNAFLEDVDNEQLGASLDGSINLKDMRLKSTLFDDWPVPFQLEYGRVGQIYLELPYWNMFSSPVEIKVKDVFGLVRIKPMSKWSKETEQEAFKEASQQMLEQFEQVIKQKLELEKAKQSHQKDEKGSFMDTLVSNIVNNLRINIENIYFRFEHQMSGQKDPRFAMGLRLKEFNVFTPDPDPETLDKGGDKKKQPDDSHLLNYKKAVLDGFSYYVDWDQVDKEENGGVDLQKLRAEDRSNKKEQQYFRKILDDEFVHNTTQHKYMIEDFKIEVSLTFNKDKADPSKPATLKHPQLQGDVFIGGSGRGASREGALRFSKYQPQILRILKVTEITGFYNEFKDGVLAKYQKGKLSQVEQQEYIKEYKAWKVFYDQEKGEDPEAKKYRDKMRVFEDRVTCPKIIQLRSIAQQQMKQNNKLQKDEDDIESQIQAEISEKVGWGFFTSAEEKKQIERDVRKKFSVKKMQLNFKRGFMSKIQQNIAKKEIDTYNEDEQQQQFDQLQADVADHEVEYTYEIPPDYKLQVFNIRIDQWVYTYDNEYGHQLLELNLENFAVTYIAKRKRMEVTIELQDFEIRDTWSKSPYYNKLIEAKEELNTSKLQETYSKAKALIIEYIADENFKICPFQVKIDVDKPLYITVLFPLINELKRSVNAAFEDQAMDFQYFKGLSEEQIRQGVRISLIVC